MALNNRHFTSHCRILLLAWLSFVAPAVAANPATPVDPVRAIVAAFKDHSIVALGDGDHGNVQIHELRLKLIRDPQFREQVRDIVVEFGNSRHQAVIDRYVRGEAVPEAVLRQVWEDTAQANPVWDVPVYAEFYRAVREVNTALPRDRRLRVILGDVPFDWRRVRTLADYRRQPQRSDVVTAGIIRREVLAKGRRALVIYGEVHLLRHPLRVSGAGPDSIVSQLEAGGTKVYSIYTNAVTEIAGLQPGIAAWPAPALALIKGTPLGAASFATYNPTVSTPADPSDPAALPMERQFDAILYLGPQSTLRGSLPSPSLCADEAYLKKRFFRMELVGMGRMIAAARQYCAMMQAQRRPRG